jgi:effector-binding domain-containing protein
MPAYAVEQSLSINVAPDVLFPFLADFRQWPRWSPWLVVEPEARLDFAADGKSYAWDGRVIGAGSIESAGVEAPKTLDFVLRFLRPFKSTSTTRMVLAPESGGTRVTWSMAGKLPFFLFFLKPMLTNGVRMDFERGLARLKDLAETGEVPSQLDFVGERRVPGCAWVGLRGCCPIAEIGPRMDEAFQRLGAQVEKGGIQPAGKPFTQYERWDLAHGQARYLIAFPVAALPDSLPEGFVAGQRPDAKVFTVRHTGPYRHLGNAWAAVMMRRQAKLLHGAKGFPPFEIYESDPRQTAENELVTDIHFPLV